MAPAFILILAVLTVESSYSQATERPVTQVTDTVQFWFAPDSQWRIKTFAIDHDIHLHNLGDPRSGKRLDVKFAVSNIKKSYGDVVSSIVVLRFRAPHDAAEVQRILRAHKLPGTLEVAQNGFAFYNLDGGRYRTGSWPQ
jgi:hypothetical protein